MPLVDTLQQLESTRAVDLAWARRKFTGFYHRYPEAPSVGRRFGEMALETARRLDAGPRGAIADPSDAAEATDLLMGVIEGDVGPAEMRRATGLGMEAVVALHRLTGGHREAYFEALAKLPELNAYQPTYITMGPTGRCNVVCPDCIIGGAIFKKERQRLQTSADVQPFLAQAAESGVTRVSLCIGEPTYNTRVLFDTFDQIRAHDAMEARSMVTNGLFARRLDKAVAFFRGVVEHLGEDKARKLMVGLSLNDDLRDVGVPVAATANVIEAYGQVFPGHRMVLQLIMDEGFHRIQNDLYRELGARGLLPDADRFLLEREGTHPELLLTSGLRVIISLMRKQPSLHNPWSRLGDDERSDPWVRYYTRDALERVAMKGLYTYEDGEPGEGGIVVHRITLGPDGILYPDYHFMVAHTRPLGTSIVSAVDSFRRDPILTLLLKRGGLNLLLSTYMAIPADQRVLPDIYAPAILGSTTGMVAANVLFGDYEVALELAGQLLTKGVSAPSVSDDGAAAVT